MGIFLDVLSSKLECEVSLASRLEIGGSTFLDRSSIY